MSGNTPVSKSPGFAVAESSGYQQYDKQDAFLSAATTIPEKYKGTRADQDDMVLLGKKQVLRRNFKFTTILGFASTGKCGGYHTVVPHLANCNLSLGCMGNAAGLVRLRSTGRRHGHRVLGIDRRCHRHDLCLYIFGRDGINVSFLIPLLTKRTLC
jgi:hypothetical protein